MKTGKAIFNQKQNSINYCMAEAYYHDLCRTTSKYISLSRADFGDSSFKLSSLITRNYQSDGDFLQLYCLRAKMIRLAETSCEFYCRALLLENGGCWKETKSLGKNMLDCYNLLRCPDKMLVASIPTEYIMNSTIFYPLIVTPSPDRISYTDDVEDNDGIPITDYLQSFAEGRLLPNVKAVYQNFTSAEFCEQFVLALAKLLYSFVYTKQAERLTCEKDKNGVLFDLA